MNRLDFAVKKIWPARPRNVGNRLRLLGRALVGKRDQAVIATTFGFKIENGKSVGLDSRPGHIRKAIEGSLRRFRTDRIDMLYQYRVDPRIPIEDEAGPVGSDIAKEAKIQYF